MYSSLTFGLALSFISVYILYYYIENRVQAAGIDLRGLNPHYLVSLSNIGEFLVVSFLITWPISMNSLI